MKSEPPIVTVTLNPAIDQTLSIDEFQIGSVNRVRHSQSHAAGKGVNVAVTLADLGVRVVATGFLGDKNQGAFVELFKQKRIDDRFVRVAGETRTGIKIIDERGGQTTDINFPGLHPASEDVSALCDRVNSLAAPNRWFVLSGSVPGKIGDDIYARLIDIVRAKGGQILLDTSGKPLEAALASRPDVVKPNVAELAELAKRALDAPADIVSAARDLLLSRGVKLAVVSMGSGGALFIERDRALLASPPRVPVKSTVGAGDAMVAGIVLSQHEERDVEACARLATALGAYAVTRVGAGLDHPGAHEQYIGGVTIESI